MELIRIEVTGNIARVTERPSRITSGTVGLPIVFTFDDQWEGLNKTAVFRGSGITKIVESPLTDMFRDGSMPRYTYHFSDVEFAGYTAEGDPIFAMSLYDYWNDGTTNELYLYIPGHETDEMDYETWEPIVTPDRMFNLGNTGNHNIIASIHSAEVTGGVDAEEETLEPTAVNKLATFWW